MQIKKKKVLPLLLLLSLFTGAVWVLFHSSQAFFTDNFSFEFAHSSSRFIDQIKSSKKGLLINVLSNLKVAFTKGIVEFQIRKLEWDMFLIHWCNNTPWIIELQHTLKQFPFYDMHSLEFGDTTFINGQVILKCYS